ncbi:hypothetical protein C2S51_030656 [Perilla frutescens var. frutescens]|nr:hypothetical protein C2S51_030656 [Perilla frutescens var. frutescens]
MTNQQPENQPQNQGVTMQDLQRQMDEMSRMLLQHETQLTVDSDVTVKDKF